MHVHTNGPSLKSTLFLSEKAVLGEIGFIESQLNDANITFFFAYNLL